MQENNGLRTKETKNKDMDQCSENDTQKNPSDRQSKEGPTPIYLNNNSTLRTPEEQRHDQSVDSTKNTTMSPSDDDLGITIHTITKREKAKPKSS